MSALEDQLDLQAHEAVERFEREVRGAPYPWSLSSAFGFGYKSAVSGAGLEQTQMRSRIECFGAFDEEVQTAIAYGHHAGTSALLRVEPDWANVTASA